MWKALNYVQTMLSREKLCFLCQNDFALTFPEAHLRVRTPSSLFTWDNEHDSRGQCHGGFGGVLHIANADTLQGEDRHQEANGTQDDAHNHQGSHCLQHGCGTRGKIQAERQDHLNMIDQALFNKTEQPKPTSTKLLRSSKSINYDLCHCQEMWNGGKCRTFAYKPLINEGHVYRCLLDEKMMDCCSWEGQ